MTDIRIRPGHAKGTVKAPPSKSQLHRSLIAAGNWDALAAKAAELCRALA